MALRIILLYALLLVAPGAFAQVSTDTLSNTASIDSSKNIHPSDSLKMLESSIKTIPANAEDSVSIPSLETHTQKYQARLDSITSVRKSAAHGGARPQVEGLKPFNLPGDSLRQQVTHKKDSLARRLNLDLPTDRWQRKLDSLEQKTLDTLATRIQQKLSRSRPAEDSLTRLANTPDDAVNQVQDKVQRKVDQATSQPSQRLNDIADPNVLENTDLPVKNLPTSQVSTAGSFTQPGLPANNLADAISTDPLDGNQGALNRPTEDLALPTNDLPEVNNGLGDIQPDIDIAGELGEATDIGLENPLDGAVGDVKSKVDNPMQEVQELKAVETAKDKSDGLQEITSEIDGIESDVAAAKAGDSEALEGRVADQLDMADDIDEVRQQQLEMEELQVSYEDKLKMMREWQDQEVFQQKLEEALTQEGPRYFMGKEEKILEGQQLLFAYKQKYNEVSSIKDLPEQEAKAVRSERFLDRFLIGTDMEFVRADVNFLDIAPYVGYELTRKWHIKAGYGWRINVVIKDGMKVKTSGTHGLRTSINYLVYKGFIALAGYERSQMEIPEVTPGIKERTWSDVALIGVRKKYKIFKSLHGDVQVLYNIPLSDHTLYENRVNLRFGFFCDFTAKHN